MHVMWLIENHIIFVRDTPIVSHEATLKMNADIIHLFEESPKATVHLVVTALLAQQYPTNIFWLNEHMTFVRHPKYGYNLTITSKPILRFIGRIVYKANGKRIPRFVSTYADARQLMATLDPNLPELPETLPIHSV